MKKKMMFLLLIITMLLLPVKINALNTTEAKEKIDTSLSLIEEQAPIDMVELEVKSSWNILGEIIGATYQDEFLDELFSRFCLGK